MAQNEKYSTCFDTVSFRMPYDFVLVYHSITVFLQNCVNMIMSQEIKILSYNCHGLIDYGLKIKKLDNIRNILY